MSKASFEMKFKGLLWFITSGIQFLMVAWYRRSPVFYLPMRWFGPAEWVLSMPFAERGMPCSLGCVFVSQDIIGSGSLIRTLAGPSQECILNMDISVEHDLDKT